MGEYLKIKSYKKSDKEIKQIIKTYFKGFPNLLKSLYVQDKSIQTKLATCETIFFDFEDICKLQEFIENNSKDFYLDMQGNSTPEEILKARTSLYTGMWGLSKKKIDIVLNNDCDSVLDHYDVWQKGQLIRSKNKKMYWVKYKGHETSGCSNNPNGKKFSCPNQNKTEFKVFRKGFAFDSTTNKGRYLFECPKCNVTFNNGEFNFKPKTQLNCLKKIEVSL